MDYPIFDVAIGGGMLMGIVAIAHVVVAHFAIGGGFLVALTETVAVRRGDTEMRELARRSSLMLVLVSTVFGAISGVGIWVVAGLISPAAISALIRNYVWGWAIEWVFFVVEIVAALVYYTTWNRIGKRTHLMVGWIYFVAAFLSLVVINGIITFMLTPGRWLETRAFWDGFFNPTYWPSLVLRTGITLILAASFMVLVAGRTQDARARLGRWLGRWLVVGVLIAYGGYRWWEAALPESTRALFLGDSPAMQTLAATRSLTLWALAATLVLGVVILLLFPRGLARAVPGILVLAAAATFFGGYERLREGARKPFLIHDFMFSNGVRVDEIDYLNEHGILSRARWAARRAGSTPVEMGEQIFRAQCASCHTIDGYQGIRPLLKGNEEMAFGVLYTMYEQGQAYADLEPGQSLDKSELDYPFMPPFVGTDEEMEALAEYLVGIASTETEIAQGGAER